MTDGPLDHVGLTVLEAAGFFGVAQPTIRAWLSRHKIQPMASRWELNRYVNVYPFVALAEADRSARLQPRGRPRKSCPRNS